MVFYLVNKHDKISKKNEKITIACYIFYLKGGRDVNDMRTYNLICLSIAANFLQELGKVLFFVES